MGVESECESADDDVHQLALAWLAQRAADREAAFVLRDGPALSAVNSEFAQLMLLDESDLVGADIRTIVHPEDVLFSRRRARHMRDGKTDEDQTIVRLRRSDGQYVRAMTTAASLRDHAGVFVGYLVRVAPLPPELPGVQFVDTYAQLFVDLDGLLVVFDHHGNVKAAAGRYASGAETLDGIFDAASVDALLQVFADRSGTGVRVIDACTVGGTAGRARVSGSPFTAVFAVGMFTADDPGEAAALRDLNRSLERALERITDVVLDSSDLVQSSRRKQEQLHRLLAGLSERERYVVRSVAKGHSSRRIADDLFLSSSAVRNYLSSIYRKLGVQSLGALRELLAQRAT